MPRKSNTPEAVLQRVVAKLEDEAPRGHRAALEALLIEGPLVCPDAVLQALQQPDAASWGEIRAELIAFLRTVVRNQEFGSLTAKLGVYGPGPLTFSVTAQSGGQVACRVDGSVRDLVVLQLVLLLHEIGFGQVRVCRDIKCQRLFVKRYRRDFCSTRCQKRVHTYLARLKEREETRRREGLRKRNRRAR